MTRGRRPVPLVDVMASKDAGLRQESGGPGVGAAGVPCGPDIEFSHGWLTTSLASALHGQLIHALSWGVHRVRLFGREIDSPRLSCWIGDPGAVYRYSGSRHAPLPWPDSLLPLRDRLARETGVPFNSVLANLYRDGSDCMGWHSDDEPALGTQPVIASLSLGATRRFVLRHRRDPSRKLVMELPHGSLLVMGGDTQKDYRHALPRTARPVGSRINLTFRRILPTPD